VNIRRTIGFLVTVGLIGRLCYQLAWEPELRDRLLEEPWQSVGLLVLMVVAVAALVWAVLDPDSWKVILAFLLGLATAIWGRELLEGITWSQIGILVGILAGLVVLWVITTWDELFGT
jgi:apolipoprotein N-acyltransferase